jgi:hypothetical protein
MVARLTSEPVVPDGMAGTDLSLEPVEPTAAADPSGVRQRAHDRLRLRLRVAVLEAALARARRRRALVVEQYERALDRREGGESAAFSWRD